MPSRPRSFRVELATRFAVALGALVVLGSAAGYWALRSTLYERLDAVLVRLASIEAAATADSPDESVHFHDDVFIDAGAGHDSVLVRYAEVWTVAGEPVLHTSNLGDQHLTLPTSVREHVTSTGRLDLFTVTHGGQRFRSVLYPLGLVGPQHQAHLLQVAVSTQDTDATIGRAAAFLVALVVAGLVIGGAFGWWIAGFAVRPVLAIIGEAEAMDAAREGHRISVEASSAELRRLVAVLNNLLARIDAVLASQRRFLADAGHAIRTPLTVLRGNLDVALLKDRTPGEYRAVLDATLADLKDVSHLADGLIHLARSESTAPAVRREVVPLSPLLEALARRFGAAATRAGITLRTEASEAAPAAILADAASLEHALANLVDNAVKYAGAGAEVVLAARIGADGLVNVTVADTGRGIPRDEQERVFDRFYRGEAGRSGVAGSGLGLAIVQASVQSWGGILMLTSEPGRGTVITVRGPAATRLPT